MFAGRLKTVAAMKADVAALAFFGSALTAWATNLNLEMASRDQMVRLNSKEQAFMLLG